MRSFSAFRSALMLLLSLMLVYLLPLDATPAALAAGTYTGTVFQDYNGNGSRDLTNTVAAVGGGEYTAAIDRGVPDITVTLYDADGGSVSTTTDADGELLAGFKFTRRRPYRLEFTDYEGQSLRSNPNTTNAQTGTSVQFVPDGGGTFDMALNNAQDYCQDDPQVISQCYVYGDQTTDDPVLVSYPYGAGVEDSAAYRTDTDLTKTESQPHTPSLSVRADGQHLRAGLRPPNRRRLQRGLHEAAQRLRVRAESA